MWPACNGPNPPETATTVPFFASINLKEEALFIDYYACQAYSINRKKDYPFFLETALFNSITSFVFIGLISIIAMVYPSLRQLRTSLTSSNFFRVNGRTI